MTEHRSLSRRLLVQPHVGIAVSVVGAAALAENWLLSPPDVHSPGDAGTILGLVLVLIGALYVARQFPVHLRYTLKVEMVSVPLYLMAVLLTPALAGTAVLLGMTLI